MTTATNKSWIDDYMKIAIWWGRNDTFDSGRYKSINRSFSGGNGKVFGCWVGFSPISRVSHKGSREGRQSTLGGCNKPTGQTFGMKGDTSGIILGDNAAGYCFVWRDLVSSSFSNKSWLRNWKCTPQTKYLVIFV